MNDLPTLKIVRASGPAEVGLQELARRMGLMEEFGVQAEYLKISDGAEGLAAVLEGRADAAFQIGFGPALAAAERGAPIRIIAGANQRAVHAVFTSDPAVKSVRDLAGHSIGIGTPGALTHQLMTAILMKAGVSLSSVRFVTVGNSDAVFQAVAKREVDAGLGEVDNVHQQAEFGIHALPDGNLWDELPAFTNQACYTTQAVIDAKRDQLVGALAASAKLFRFICAPGSWEVFAEAKRAAFPNADPDEAKAQWDFYQTRKPYALDLEIDEERLLYMQNINIAMGVQTRLVRFGELADLSLARDAIRLLERRAAI